MQAYCLEQLLRERWPEADVEIIDYRSSATETSDVSTHLKQSLAQIAFGHTPTQIFRHSDKKESVREFLNNNCTVSSISRTTDNLQEATKYIQSLDYDVIFVGSDTVWSVRKNGGGPTPPNIFQLPGVDSAKFGFSVSMDQTNDSLLQDLSDKMYQYISEFDCISVRDRYTQQRLQRLGIPKERIHYMPDPTLLWDFSKHVEQPPIELNQNTVGLEIENLFIKRKITKQLRKQGKTVLNLLGPAVRGQKSPPSNLSVSERIGVYDELDFLITNRFHGSIFTIKTTSTPFVYIEQKQKYPDNMSKVRDLYTRLGISDLIIESDGNIPNEIIKTHRPVWEENQDKMQSQLNNLIREGSSTFSDLSDSIMDVSN